MGVKDQPAAGAPTTGLPGLDVVLHGVARGDNIVWQVQGIAEYRALVTPYVVAARRAGRRLIYFRFADHPALAGVEDGVEVHRPRPEDGFEAFVDQVHGVIEEAGRETWYIFDCLSVLAGCWQSDEMVGHFFRLTCPRLFDLETVTYFAILRNTHQRSAVQLITETTQYLLDVFRCRERLYVRPIKVQHRSRAAMNLIHAWEGEQFRPVTDSATVCDILAGSEWPGLEADPQPGFWRRLFVAARGERGDAARAAGHFERLSRLLLGGDPAMQSLLARYLTLDDLLAVRDRMIGNGPIGGKSVGMLLARAIVRREEPALAGRLEAHDSFYVGAEVFHAFLVRNGLWWIRRRQRDPATFLSQLGEARERIQAGAFPPEVVSQLESMLDYFGEWPFIVRSSSLLEDRYGNAFAGQYESVFCVNQGPRERRLAGLLDAIRRVYASALGEQALRYRERRGLLDRDEQMALLIMRVSGTSGARFFLPHAAGVGLSVNPYPWDPRIDRQAGVVRLVAGLGTRAVDRVDDDYTRLVALNAPELRPESNFDAVARYAQRRLDALDLVDNQLVARRVEEILAERPDFPAEHFVARERPEGTPVLTFEGLLHRTPLVADLRRLLEVLQGAYQHPVEIEFTLNFPPDGPYRLNLLQCRPMQVRGNGAECGGGEAPADGLRLVESAGAVIGPSRALHLSRIVFVVPRRYAQLNLSDRHAVARLIGRINQAGRDHTTLLMGPGRWGTRDPWLGIPVAFAEINRVAALGEIVAMREGLVPDVSLGTHFINELVETDVLYFALFPDRPGNRLEEERLLASPNRLGDLVSGAERWRDIVWVIDVPPGARRLFADSSRQRVTLVAAGSRELAPPAGSA